MQAKAGTRGETDIRYRNEISEIRFKEYKMIPGRNIRISSQVTEPNTNFLPYYDTADA